ncbi:MAG: DUF4870 domain-containing protein [Mycobacteriales bacterium]
MTDPNAPSDPQMPNDPYAGPPAGQPQYPGQPGPPPAGPPATAPFSPLVGRQLTSDETMWSMLSHLGGIILGFIAPLIVMLTKGNESPYIRYHAVEALNFQILIAIGYVISSVLTVVIIGLLGFFVLPVVSIIFSVIAGLAANKGEAYRYPLSIRMVK